MSEEIEKEENIKSLATHIVSAMRSMNEQSADTKKNENRQKKEAMFEYLVEAGMLDENTVSIADKELFLNGEKDVKALIQSSSSIAKEESESPKEELPQNGLGTNDVKIEDDYSFLVSPSEREVVNTFINSHLRGYIKRRGAKA